MFCILYKSRYRNAKIGYTNDIFPIKNPKLFFRYLKYLYNVGGLAKLLGHAFIIRGDYIIDFIPPSDSKGLWYKGRVIRTKIE